MLYDLCRNTLRVATPATPDGLQAMVDVHGKVTGLFSEISDLEKRSLASKYLHFHVPRLFFIFDSRAVEAMREFSDVLPRASRSEGNGDNEYRTFAERATALVQFCEREYGLFMLPRRGDHQARQRALGAGREVFGFQGRSIDGAWRSRSA